VLFPGIGIAWTMAAIVNKVRGEKFEVEPGSLGFSVTLFVVFAIVAIILILIRRSKAIGEQPLLSIIQSIWLYFTGVVFLRSRAPALVQHLHQVHKCV